MLCLLRRLWVLLGFCKILIQYCREKDLGGGADIQARRVNAKKEKMMRERGIDPIALQMTGGGPSSHQPGPSFQRHQTDRSGDDRKLEQQASY